MSSIEELAAEIRAHLDSLARLAEDAEGVDSWRAIDTPFGPKVQMDSGDPYEAWARGGQGLEAAYRCDDPYDDCDSARAGYLAEARLIEARADPRRTLAEVFSRRALVDALLAEPHASAEDSWYSCPQTRDAVGTQRGEPCDCGRDNRVRCYLEMLVQPYRTETTK